MESARLTYRDFVAADTARLIEMYNDPDSHRVSIACFVVPEGWEPHKRDDITNITYKVLGAGEDACDGTPFKSGYEVHRFSEDRFEKAMRWLKGRK